MVIELKVKRGGKKNRNDNPVSALMQGLRYSAIVDSNRKAIAKEAQIVLT